MLPSSLSSMLNSFLRSGLDTIISACDPTQNLGQIQTFYKLGQPYLTWPKCDLDNLGGPTQFNSGMHY